jgi:hypothetical protein
VEDGQEEKASANNNNTQYLSAFQSVFPNKDVVKTNDNDGFMLNTQRWGEFIIAVELVLYDNRRLIVEHYLSLFSKDRKRKP